MVTVVVLGAGNVAYHISKKIQQINGFKLVQIFNRTLNHIDESFATVPATNTASEIIDADLYIVSVSDDYIAKISECLLNKNGLVVHTSGSTDVIVLEKHKNFGVFYPLQTFSKNKPISFDAIPICIEANNEAALTLLKTLGHAFSNEVHVVSSEQRKGLHLAAVFVCNFVNHMYTIGSDLCEQHELPFEILKPLIGETADKIHTLHPRAAQTGPAKRNDRATLKNHQNYLSIKSHKKIYKIISKAIKKTYEL